MILIDSLEILSLFNLLFINSKMDKDQIVNNLRTAIETNTLK